MGAVILSVIRAVIMAVRLIILSCIWYMRLVRKKGLLVFRRCEGALGELVLFKSFDFCGEVCQ